MEKLQRSFDEGNGFYTFYELLDGKMSFKPLMLKVSAKSFLSALQSIQNLENKSFKLRAVAALCKNKLSQKTSPVNSPVLQNKYMRQSIKNRRTA